VPPSLPIAQKDKNDKSDKGGHKAAAEPEPEAPAAARGARAPTGPSTESSEEVAAEEGAAPSELVTLPSFTGMSIGEAIRAARRVGVELAVEGERDRGGPGAGRRAPAARLGVPCVVSAGRLV
jgi:hypothetical protein